MNTPQTPEPEPSTLQERAEQAFHTFLESCRIGPAPDETAFVAAQPAALRAELRRMLTDYSMLRNTIGEATSGFVPGREFGDFRLVRELGRGGMGVVWEAEQLSLARRVALKLLYPHWSLSPHLLERFQREAEAGGRLTHPAIVRVYSVGECESTHYIAQELVPGGLSLADSLEDLREEATLPAGYFPSVAELFATIAEALQSAHEAGVVHRDVKPGNILVAEDDSPKVADFGLAKIQDELTLSRTGELTGTPFYMSPEQAASKRIGIDHRTDVFSLGATLYEALTLRRPFAGESTQQVMEQILLEDPADPRQVRSDVPRDLAVICLKALEKKRERRYASMAELAADLRRCLAGEPIAARPAGPVYRATKLARRHPLAATATAAVLLGLGIGVLATWRAASGGGAEVHGGMAVRQVWADDSLVGSPSPDGRYLTFTDWESHGELAVHDLVTDENRHVTSGAGGRDGWFADFSVVSPDQTRIAYAWFNSESRFELRVVGFDGSDPRVVFDREDVEGLSPMAWSPDSKSVLSKLKYADRTFEIALIPVDGGEVLTLGREKSLEGAMGFAPDGRTIVYSRPASEDTRRHDVFLRSLKGGEERPLVSHPADDLVLGWTPEGSHVLFASDRRGSWDAWLIGVVGGQPSGDPVLVQPIPAEIHPEGGLRGFVPMGFTPDGSFYYGEMVDLFDVYVAAFDPATGEVGASPVRATQRLPGTNEGAAWSSDGSELAFVSRRDGEYRIARVSEETSETRHIEVSDELDSMCRRSLSWSPDGERFLTNARDDALTGSVWRLFLIEASSGKVTLVGAGEASADHKLPEWSPDGRSVYYVRTTLEPDTVEGIFELDLETGRERLLLQCPMWIGSLALSPDGRWLVFAQNVPGGPEAREVRVLSVEGGEPRTLVASGGDCTFPLWTPTAWTADGQHLLFGRHGAPAPTGWGENPIELMRIPFEGGTPESTGLTMPWLFRVRINPDGDRIAFEAGVRRRGVWVIENFLPEPAPGR